jgi:hypothetical protein
MSMGPTWNQGAEPPPAPKSGSKTWLILGVVLGVCVLLCCGSVIGVSVFFGSQVANMMSADPVEIGKATAEIGTIDIPAELPPKFKFDVSFVGQRHSLLVYYGAAGDDNKLWLAASGNALQQQFGSDPDEMRNQLEIQLNAQGQNAQAGGFKTLSGTTQRELEITVNGKAANMVIVDGTDSAGKKLTQVTGMFEGKGGPTLIKMQLDSDKFPPERVDEILNSIK